MELELAALACGRAGGSVGNERRERDVHVFGSQLVWLDFVLRFVARVGGRATVRWDGRAGRGHAELDVCRTGAELARLGSPCSMVGRFDARGEVAGFKTVAFQSPGLHGARCERPSQERIRSRPQARSNRPRACGCGPSRLPTRASYSPDSRSCGQTNPPPRSPGKPRMGLAGTEEA